MRQIPPKQPCQGPFQFLWASETGSATCQCSAHPITSFETHSQNDTDPLGGATLEGSVKTMDVFLYILYIYSFIYLSKSLICVSGNGNGLWKAFSFLYQLIGLELESTLVQSVFECSHLHFHVYKNNQIHCGYQPLFSTELPKWDLKDGQILSLGQLAKD